MQAKKQYGQHFLKDQQVLADILKAIAPEVSDRMIEIGPGLGAMTKILLPFLKELTAIEIDKDCIAKLSTLENLAIIHEDVLNFNWQDLSHKTRVVGNLPYNIATEIFFLCLSSENISDMHFMMQAEVAQRLIAQPSTKAYGRLTVMMQMQADVDLLFNIPPQAFRPEPKVMSSFCRILPNNDTWFKDNQKLIYQVVTAAFSRRRKQCHHNLKRWFTKSDLEYVGILPEFRAENITVNQYKKLVQSIA